MPSETYRFEGMGADGAVTLANDIVFSEVVVGRLNGGTTYTSDGKTVTELPPSSTITEEPKTIHATLIAGASNYVWSVDEDPAITYPNIIVSCALDGKGGGTCVDKVWASGEQTLTSTYTGVALPARTLVFEDAPGPGGSGGGGDTKNNSAAKPSSQIIIAGGAVALSTLTGFFLGI
ncbi:hypothetical protein BDZ94DRAFT_1270401 [Collybia nuda]|uniref:Uncharacterized protein n=1 Tax=Collybia nuda TaxID=64659 RepID=A0A9P6CEY2_9AGAR|nr:hypothetical protein BDZ94DRAFT_1270401 [Collybia nuda]